MGEVVKTSISGVELLPLKIIETADGPVLHLLKANSPFLPDFREGFGEIYFSETLPGKIKAWKRHKLQTQLFAVPRGLLKIVLFDSRPDSPSFGESLTTILGRPNHYYLLRIPPMVWHGFEALGTESALLCNCADRPHDSLEGENLAPASPNAPLPWL